MIAPIPLRQARVLHTRIGVVGLAVLAYLARCGAHAPAVSSPSSPKRRAELAACLRQTSGRSSAKG